MSERGSVLVVGAGDATGGAIARRFAREGLVACVTRRNARQARAAGRADPRRRRRGARLRVGRAQGSRRRDAGRRRSSARSRRSRSRCSTSAPTSASTSPTPPSASTARSGRWRALAGFLMGREVAKAMLPRGRGTILFTGATASVRGSAGFAAFAGAKHALRALAQSMARELGPKGIHVAHIVVDGAIDTQFIAENFPERYALKEQDGILDPEAIAENYWTSAPPVAQRLDARARPAGPGWKSGERHERTDEEQRARDRVLLRRRQPDVVPRLDAAAEDRRRHRRDDRLAADAARRRVQGDRQREPGRGAGEGPLDERDIAALGRALRRGASASTRTSRSTR